MQSASVCVYKLVICLEMYVPQTHDENMMGDHMKTQLVNAIHLQEVEMQEKSKQIANHSSGDGESVPF